MSTFRVFGDGLGGSDRRGAIDIPDRADDRPMAELAARWSELLVDELPANVRLTEAARAGGSLLREPATHEQVEAAELRLGCVLPASYREFLLVSNGAFGDDLGPTLVRQDLGDELPGPDSDVVGVGFLPVEDVTWFLPPTPGPDEPGPWLLVAGRRAAGCTVLVPFADEHTGEVEWQLQRVRPETADSARSSRTRCASASR
jgi:hypothetical protein